MAWLRIYKDGAWWYSAEIEESGPTVITSPTKDTEYYGYTQWEDAGYEVNRYTHKVPVIDSSTIGDPSNPTISSWNTYYGIIRGMFRNYKKKSYPTVTWNLEQPDGTVIMRNQVSSTGIDISFSNLTGQYDAYLYFTFNSSVSTETEYGSYWTEHYYDLPSQPIDNWIQNNYTGYGSVAPGTNDFDTRNIYQDVTWSISYRKQIYTATLDKNGGTGGTDGPIYQWANKWYSDSSATNSITSISIPTKTGYSFEGYYVGNEQVIKSNGEIKSEYTISSNTTAKAKWKAKTYTVTFDLNNPMTEDDQRPDCDSTSKTVTYDSSYGDLPTPSRVGYDFDGWYTSATGSTKISSDTIYKTANNSTIYAHWNIKWFTVKATNSTGIVSVKVGDNTAGESSTGTYKYWEPVRIKATVDEETEPVPGTGYNFSEWLDLNDLNPAGRPKSVSNANPLDIEHVKKDINYQGTTYSGAKHYTVILSKDNNFIDKCGYYRDGSQVVGTTISDLLYGQIIELWALPKNDMLGYCEFDGWFNGNIPVGPENKPQDLTEHYEIKVIGNMTLKAKGHLEVPRFEIKLKNNGCNNTNQNGGTVSINYTDGYGFNSGIKIVNPGETKSVYVLKNLANNSSLKLKVEDIGYNYQFKNWVKGDWSSTDLEWEVKTITQPGTYEANFELWNLDGATWKGYYIFVKTSDPDLPWKIVKEIKIKTKDTGEESDWKRSSKAPSQP